MNLDGRYCDCIVADVDLEQQANETSLQTVTYSVKADTGVIHTADVSDSESSVDDSKKLHSYLLLVLIKYLSAGICISNFIFTYM